MGCIGTCIFRLGFPQPLLFSESNGHYSPRAFPVICYLDDILVTGLSEDELLENLSEALDRLSKHGLKLKREKCSIMKDSVYYLGRIDAQTLPTTCFTEDWNEVKLGRKVFQVFHTDQELP